MDIRGPLNNSIQRGDVSQTHRHEPSHRVEGGKKPHLSKKASLRAEPHSTVMSRLTEELQRVPAVREELVSQVSERLKAGHYFTKAAAQQTAAVMMKGFET